MKVINAGLLGAGTVGSGVYKVATENAEIISKRLGAELRIKRVADIDPNRKRAVKIPKSIFTKDSMEVIKDDSIDIIIELIGGTTVARDYMMEAIKSGKHVVTANKALLAHYGKEIFLAAAENSVEMGFEASVGGGIPVIRAIREGYVANRIESIHGIMNGTTNYILSKMTEEGRSFADVLEQAQKEGYAEADPSFDIDGIDAAHKISILVMLSWGKFFEFESIPVEGIRHITPVDISFTEELGFTIKLLSIAKAHEDGLEISVHPALVDSHTPLANVSGAFNAIHIEGDAVGPTMLYGMGAGMMPTASAVVSDVVEIAGNIIYGSPSTSIPKLYNDGDSIKLIPPSELISRFYLRFQVEDRPGVLGHLAGLLGKHGIGIESVIQKGRHIGGGEVPVVIMTHEVEERRLHDALREINEEEISNGNSVFLRIAEI